MLLIFCFITVSVFLFIYTIFPFAVTVNIFCFHISLHITISLFLLFSLVQIFPLIVAGEIAACILLVRFFSPSLQDCREVQISVSAAAHFDNSICLCYMIRMWCVKCNNVLDSNDAVKRAYSIQILMDLLRNFKVYLQD